MIKNLCHNKLKLVMGVLVTMVLAWAVTPALAYAYDVTCVPAEGGVATCEYNFDKDSVIGQATPNTGYEFVEWLYDIDNPPYSVQSDIMVTNNPFYLWGYANPLNVRAFFRQIDYTITVSSDHGTFSAPETAYYGDEVTLSVTPDTGYTLKTVTYTPVDGTPVDITDTLSFKMPPSDVTIEVTYEEDPKYTVTTVASPAEGGKATADPTSTYAGEQVDLSAEAAEGYSFVRWEIEGEGHKIEDASAASTKLSLGEANVTATAVFEKNPEPVDEVIELEEYTIRFKANGGEGSMDALTVEEGESVKLTANAFKRSGYTFVGWNTEKDGSGDAYDNREKVTPEEDLTLYAQWEKVPSKPSKSESKPQAQQGPKVQARNLPATGDPLSAATCLGMALVGASLFLAGEKARRR